MPEKMIHEFLNCTHCQHTFELDIQFNSTVEAGKILHTIIGGEDDGKTSIIGKCKCPRCQSNEVFSIDL